METAQNCSSDAERRSTNLQNRAPCKGLRLSHDSNFVPVRWPKGPPRRGLRTQPRVEPRVSYVFSAGHAARRRQDSLAQGLPWVSQQNVLCPEGARNAHAIRFKGPESILAGPGGPFQG
jgi:hypothetical protein